MKKPPREYITQLNQIVDDIYDEACIVCDWSWAKLAQKADLSAATVSRLGRRITQRPHLLTVWKLAKAVGFEIRIEAFVYPKLRKAG